MTTFEKVVKYIIGLIMISCLWIGIAFLFLLAKAFASAHRDDSDRKYPSSKYRRVVKEGLLYNTTEYHER